MIENNHRFGKFTEVIDFYTWVDKMYLFYRYNR